MPTQTLTARAKVINLSDQDALLLGLLGFSATKLWNVANHHRRTVWNHRSRRIKRYSCGQGLGRRGQPETPRLAVQ
ncbi:hypothetical protein [Carboxydocella sp. JDF658]|uniref:hypothetical protein n=1 Tax=Carboxydocella sp. JDF658 TaxID=1926600 RepID=UPI0013564400|nr:hypothetical protein [Carboxydocella sp. JDF658]